jgi:hypothetical protein
MGFFDTLRRVLGSEPRPLDRKVADAWGLDETEERGAADSSIYDRGQWQKKLKRILDELPASRPEWDALVTEARALNLDPAWVTKCQIDEFLLLMRRAVSDGVFSEAEHRKLDLARDLIGIPETEAEAALHSIVSEAETFFGKSVEGA